MKAIVTNGFGRIGAMFFMLCVVVAGAMAQVVPPDLDDFATPIKESIWTYWGQIIGSVAALFGLFVGVSLVMRLIKRVTKA